MRADPRISSRTLGVVTRNMLISRPGGWDFVGFLDGLHVEKLAGDWASVHVFAFAVDERASAFYRGADLHSYVFKGPNVTLRPLPGPASPAPLDSARSYLRSLITLRKYVAACDVVYVFMPQWLSVLGAVLCALMRKPLIVYLGGDWREVGRSNVRWAGLGVAARLVRPVYGAVVNFIQQWVVRRADLALIHGPALFQRFAGLNHGKRRVVEVSPVLAISASDIHQRLDTCGGSVATILFVGLLVPNKGVEYLLRAAASLRGESGPFRIVIVGDGPQRSALEQLAEDLGLRDLVDFRGHVPSGPALLEIYRKADLFVLAALSEGFPRVLYEAMSQGVPVIASRVGGMAVALEDSVNARLIEPASTRALADAIRGVLTNGVLRKRLIAGGYRFVSNVFERVSRNHPAVVIREHFLGVEAGSPKDDHVSEVGPPLDKDFG